MEWIIVDDGTDPVGDIIEAAALTIPQIQYIRSEKHMNLGEKRNFMHTFCKGTIIVYMDDDDYYPPERVQHAVEVLQENREAMCAGSSEIYVYFKSGSDSNSGKPSGKMIQCGPYGPNHATAGTFAFRAELLKQTRYEDGAALAEEKHFLKNYTVPFAQLDPLKSILVFSHEHNTFDKRKLLENANPQFVKESPKTVDDFIRGGQKEANIKAFFLTEVDALLEKYDPGKPEMKPDVLDQIKRIEAERAAQAQSQTQQIMINHNGQEKALSQQDIVNMMNGQIQELRRLHEENQALKQRILELEQKLEQTIEQPLEQPLEKETKN